MKIIKFLTLVLFITLFSCSEKDNVDELDLQTKKELNLNFSEDDFNINFDSTLLLKYKTIEELNSKIEAKIAFIVEDSRRELALKSLKNISFTISFSNGEAKILDIIKEVNSTRNGGDVGNGACPKGGTFLGSCRHNDAERQCIADLISTHLSTSLQSIGDCAQVSVSVGVFSSSVCSSSC